uniref:PPR32 phosphatase n=1 Tax=Macrostomum lignano TaxID=282301 RepID=A0A1I8JK92_9PLAT
MAARNCYSKYSTDPAFTGPKIVTPPNNYLSGNGKSGVPGRRLVRALREALAALPRVHGAAELLPSRRHRLSERRRFCSVPPGPRQAESPHADLLYSWREAGRPQAHWLPSRGLRGARAQPVLHLRAISPLARLRLLWLLSRGAGPARRRPHEDAAGAAAVPRLPAGEQCHRHLSSVRTAFQLMGRT